MKLQPKCLTGIKSGLMPLFLGMLLTSCSTIRFPNLPPCTVTQPVPEGMTNRDVIELARARAYDVELCEAKLDSWRAFIRAHPKLSVESPD